MGKSIKKNFIYNTVLTVGNMVIPLITFPYVSRVLDPKGLGMANYANSVVSYLILFACFGVNTYGIKEGAKHRDCPDKMKSFVWEMMIINACTVTLALIALAILCVIPFHKPYILLLWIYGLQIVTSSFSMSWFVSAIEEFKYVTVRSLAIQVLCMILTFICIRDSSDYVIYASVSVISSVLTMILNMVFVHKKLSIGRIENLKIKRHIKPMILILGGSLSATIYSNSDVTMLGMFCGDYHVGIYSVSVKIVRIMITFVSSLSTVLLPRTSYYKKNNMLVEYENLLKKGLDFLLMISIPSTVGIAVLSKELILVFAGEQYGDSIINLKLLALNIVISSVSAFVAYQILLNDNGESKFLMATLLSCIVNVFLNLWLIPLFNENAAAVTTLISEALNGLICIGLSKNKVNYSKIFSNLKDYIIASVIMAACVLLSYEFIFRGVNGILILILEMLVGIISYAIALLLLRNYLFIELIGLAKRKFMK